MRHALRSLLKSPGFTAVAVLTLALGIGVNTTMFAVVRDLVVRPILLEKRANLAVVYTSRPGPTADFRPFSYPEYTALRASREIFSDVAAMSFAWAALGQPDALRRSFVGFVSENYFSLLGAQPRAGRFFSAEESQPDAEQPVAVASHAYWRRSGQPANFVGRTVQIDGRVFTIIGIAPAGFGGLHSSISPDVWMPLGVRPHLLNTATTVLNLCGSLPPGLTLDAARARLGSVENRLNQKNPADPRRLVLTPPPRFSVGNSMPTEENFLVPFAACALALSAAVLLVACLNLANMFLARGTARRKEIAIRLSLGATRWHVIRQLLAEGFVLALAGGALGLLLSLWTGDYLQQTVAETFGRSGFAFNAHPAIDPSLLVGVLVLSVVATLLFSLGPALRATRVDLVEDLKSQPGELAAASNWNRFFSLRHCLVMAQIALSLMLLFSAGLFLRGARTAITRDVGFQTAAGLVFNFDYSFTGLSAGEIARRQEALLSHAATLPGVEHAALASAVPYNFDPSRRRIFSADAPAAPGADGKITAPGFHANYAAVTPGYFQALGIARLRGRDFTAAENAGDGAPAVAVIDETLARSLFGETDALGRRIVLDQADVGRANPAREIEIVGIVRSPFDDVIEEKAPRRVYRPLGQVRRSNIYLHVKAAAPASVSALLDPLRRELRAREPEALLLVAQPLALFVEKHINLLTIRQAAQVFGALGAIALVLAVVGVYGVKAYAVARRGREFGIRLALGARPADVLRLVFVQGLLQTIVGIAVGLVLSLLAGQALSKMLYRVSPLDPFALVMATLSITAAALLACWLPARRATKVDPMIALRAE